MACFSKKTSFLSVDDFRGQGILIINHENGGRDSPDGGVIMVKFGERLKAARTAKHMSQQALADIIGKSLNTVGLYERGLRQPSLETLCLLADTLEVSSDYLLARTDVKHTATVSDCSENDLAQRVARIENHLGLK